jgi:serine/threonine protein phosphatase PrpC
MLPSPRLYVGHHEDEHVNHGYGYRSEQRLRKENQDAFGAFRIGTWEFAIICDGMGGHAGGAHASNLGVRTVVEVLQADALRVDDGDVEGIRAALVRAIEAANRAIYEASRRNYRLSGMGTTLVAALIEPDAEPGRARVHVAHVGDSRAWKIRHGEAKAITRDHTMANLFVDNDLLAAEDAASHPEAHVLSRSLGVERHVEVELAEVLWADDGDRIVLTSDGVHGPLGSSALAHLDWSNPMAGVEGAIASVERANGDDNATIVAWGWGVSGPTAPYTGLSDAELTAPTATVSPFLDEPTAAQTAPSATARSAPPAATTTRVVSTELAVDAPPAPLPPIPTIRSEPTPAPPKAGPTRRNRLRVMALTGVACTVLAAILVQISRQQAEPPKETISVTPAQPAPGVATAPPPPPAELRATDASEDAEAPVPAAAEPTPPTEAAPASGGVTATPSAGVAPTPPTPAIENTQTPAPGPDKTPTPVASPATPVAKPGATGAGQRSDNVEAPTPSAQTPTNPVTPATSEEPARSPGTSDTRPLRPLRALDATRTPSRPSSLAYLLHDAGATASGGFFDPELPSAPTRPPAIPTRYADTAPRGPAQAEAIRQVRDEACAEALRTVDDAMQRSLDHATLYRTVWYCFNEVHQSRLGAAVANTFAEFEPLLVHFQGRLPANGTATWSLAAQGGVEARLERYLAAAGPRSMQDVVLDLLGEGTVADHLGADLLLEATAAVAASRLDGASVDAALVDMWARRVFVVTRAMEGSVGDLIRQYRPDVARSVDDLLFEATGGDGAVKALEAGESNTFVPGEVARAQAAALDAAGRRLPNFEGASDARLAGIYTAPVEVFVPVTTTAIVATPSPQAGQRDQTVTRAFRSSPGTRTLVVRQASQAPSEAPTPSPTPSPTPVPPPVPAPSAPLPTTPATPGPTDMTIKVYKARKPER